MLNVWIACRHYSENVRAGARYPPVKNSKTNTNTNTNTNTQIQTHALHAQIQTQLQTHALHAQLQTQMTRMLNVWIAFCHHSENVRV